MNTSVMSAYIIGFISLVVCMVLAIVVSNSIAYEVSANPQDAKKRRMWFWILAIACPLLTLLVSYAVVYSGITIPSKKSAYMTAMGISAGVMFVAYIGVGFVLAKLNKTGKISNWF